MMTKIIIIFLKVDFFDLKKKIYKTGPTKISLKKNIFDRSENDPRLLGVSSVYKNGVTTVKKAILQAAVKTINVRHGA